MLESVVHCFRGQQCSSTMLFNRQLSSVSLQLRTLKFDTCSMVWSSCPLHVLHVYRLAI